MKNKSKIPTMGQLVIVLLAIDKAQTVPQRDLDCGPGFSGLSQIDGPNRPPHSVEYLWQV